MMQSIIYVMVLAVSALMVCGFSHAADQTNSVSLSWKFKGVEYTWTTEYKSKDLQDYRSRTRPRTIDYSIYASDRMDDQYMRELTGLFRKYYYLETTGEGWKVGSLPIQYDDEHPRLFPLIPQPIIDAELSYRVVQETGGYNVYEIEVAVKNEGALEAKNLKVYNALGAKKQGMVYSQVRINPCSRGPFCPSSEAPAGPRPPTRDQPTISFSDSACHNP